MIPAGLEALGADTGALGWLLTQQVKREMARDRKVLGSVALTDAALIFVEGHIEHPMDPILNGLITNDKICFVRSARLILGRSSRPL